MIHAAVLVEALKERGFGIFSGVPCSFLTSLINAVIQSPEVHYIKTVNEGDAVAAACGAKLGGRSGVVLMQNSGLGNAVNPLTSLSSTFKTPLLLIITWRGRPDGTQDESQHEFMGRITPNLLELMNIPWEEMPEHESEIRPAVERAAEHMRARKTAYALVVKEGIFSLDFLKRKSVPEPKILPGRPLERKWLRQFDQDTVLKAIQSACKETDVILAATGYSGRALYSLDDKVNQLYMVGSMGCVSSLGLGLALAQPKKRIIVIDGDGALLMRMGVLATIGAEEPRNLTHILLDNGVYDSTGCQDTVSSTVDLAAVAQACGYPVVISIAKLKELESELTDNRKILKFIYIRTDPRANRRLPRPKITPSQTAERLQRHLRVIS